MSRTEYYRLRYHAKRQRAIEKLGGKCARCDSTENLEFDHINSDSKEFDLGKWWSLSQKRIDAELAKCQLLCDGCHKEKTMECGDIPFIYSGSAHVGAKLAEDDVRAIRSNPDRLSQRALAERFSVSKTLVYRVIHRLEWKHIE